MSKIENKAIPKDFRKYFWDTEADHLCLSKDAAYIISRVLEKGRKEVIAWLFSVYSRSFIKSVLELRINLSPGTYNLWYNVLHD